MDNSSVLNPLLTIAAIGIVVTTLTLLKGQRRTVEGVHLPPGPAPFPLVGNFFSIDAKQPWKTYSAWATRYGALESPVGIL
jgi:hypothetical protein